MSSRITALLWPLKGITTSEKLILIWLADNANSDGIYLAPIGVISGDCGLAPRHVTRLISELVKKGFLIRQEKAGYPCTFQIVTPDAHVGGTPDTQVHTPDAHVGGKKGILPASFPSPYITPIPSSTPPAKNKKIDGKKSAGVTLVEWESNVGSDLDPQMMKVWLQANKISFVVARDLIIDFREQMISKGKIYSDFKTAFTTWCRRGYLILSLEQAQKKSAATQNVQTYDKGLSL